VSAISLDTYLSYILFANVARGYASQNWLEPYQIARFFQHLATLIAANDSSSKLSRDICADFRPFFFRAAASDKLPSACSAALKKLLPVVFPNIVVEKQQSASKATEANASTFFYTDLPKSEESITPIGHGSVAEMLILFDDSKPSVGSKINRLRPQLLQRKLMSS
jgi:hypothetical protein